MRRVIHIDEDTKYEVAGGMLFMRGRVDQTVIIAHTPEAIDNFIAALRLQREDLNADTRAHPDTEQPDD